MFADVDDTPTVAPDFELIDTSGATIRLSDFRNQADVVLVFLRSFR